MAQLTSIITATGKLISESFGARIGIQKLILSGSGTGTVEVWKSSPDISIDTSVNNINFDVAKTITRTSGSWISDGLEVGDTITISGSASNDGLFTISALTATVITVSEAVVTEAMSTGTLNITNRGEKILEVVYPGSVVDIDFNYVLRGNVGDNAGLGDFYLVLPSSVTASAVYRNTIVGD